MGLYLGQHRAKKITQLLKCLAAQEHFFNLSQKLNLCLMQYFYFYSN